MSQASTLCIVAAGSGGHILPAFTLARGAQKVLFFSSTKTLDAALAKQAPDNTTHIQLTLPKVPGRKLFRYPGYFLSLAKCTLHAFRILRKHKPHKIISTGGQLGIPVCLAGKLLCIPIEVYELNARPGRAMRVLSKLATQVLYVFDECANYLPKNKRKKTSYPLRVTTERKRGAEKILVLGGSQGSRQLNNLVRACYLTNVIHQVGGQENLEEWEAFYKDRDADVFAYRDNLAESYSQAGFAIARAGAGTIFELLHFKIPTLLVPLAASTTSHQVYNAQAIAREHPDLFVALEPNPTQEQFQEALAHLFRDAKP